MTIPDEMPEWPPAVLMPRFDPDYDLPPDSIPNPTPWTREQIEAWNLKHDAFPPGGAIAFEARMKERDDRLRVLRGKGPARMTPAEKDEALALLLERGHA